MTIEAKLHGQCLCLVGKRHRIDGAMAAFAPNALGDVDAVIEIDVIRKIGHAMPRNRLVVGQAFAYRRERRGIGPDLRMAGHAGIGRR